uniref:Uncharacterized protein n=1 Tax=Tetradesmus obliquus TaxID=3088 RepID=A0A383WKT1_TETOB|eukprot:jgi/Sobl393_1/11730/SZX77843.1
MAAEGSDEWVKIMADDFTATVSKRILLAQADSHLAQLVEYALQRNPSSPEVRLDTSAAVAAEVVAALRQGPAYALPAGDRRLLAAVKHQLDYLGLQLQPAAGEQHYLVVPTYDLATNLQDLQRPEKYGLLMYSSAARGWANRAGPRYPRGGLPRPSLSAAAYDEYSVMVVAGVKGQQARVDVLDLRTWRWREGIAQLQRPGKDSRGVSVVAYEEKVVAVGGQAAGTVGDDNEADEAQQQQQQQQGGEDEQESAFSQTGVREVWSYDPAANAWSSDGIARMPFGISRASPVVARVSV